MCSALRTCNEVPASHVQTIQIQLALMGSVIPKNKWLALMGSMIPMNKWVALMGSMIHMNKWVWHADQASAQGQDEGLPV